MTISTLFFESEEKEIFTKKHKDNISLNEAPEDDVETDPDANPDPNEVGDMSGGDNDNSSEMEGDTADSGDAESPEDTDDSTGAQSDDPNEDPNDGADSGATNGDPNAAAGDGSGVSSTNIDSGKKLHLFKDYRSLYDLINSFLDKVSHFKELTETDESKRGKFETVDFIEDKLVTLKENVKNILTDRIKTLDYEKSKTVFVHVKTEINLLIKLFDKISSVK